jgi:hypothetical protein
MQIFLDVKRPGEHVVSFSMREDGFAFDQFLLTTDRDYRPQGEERSEQRRDSPGNVRAAQ